MQKDLAELQPANQTSPTFGKTTLRTSKRKNGRGFLASLNKILLVGRGGWGLPGGSYVGLKAAWSSTRESMFY